MSRTLQTIVHGLGEHDANAALIAFGPAARTHWSYAELDQRVRACAASILAGIAGTGDRVAVIGVNSPDLVVLRLALIAAGIVTVPLDDLAAKEATLRAIAESGATAVFATADVLERLGDLPPSVRLGIAIDDPRGTGALALSMLSGDSAAAPGAPLSAVRPDDFAAIIYTSATTGAAKGVPLTHANILANVDAFVGERFVGPEDRVLMPLPLHHAYPFMAGLMVPLACGATIVLPASVSGPDLATALRESGATVMIGVPRIYEAMAEGIRARLRDRGVAARWLFGALLAVSIAARRRLGVRAGRWLMRPVRARFAPALRLMGSGGAKLAEEAAWTLEGLGFEVLTGYGLVETSSVSTFNRRGRGRIGTEGQPAPGVEIRIADPNGDGVGEIQIRGPHVFSGYYNDPAATAEAFTEDGWFRSGDLGRIEADGSVVVAGRSKDIIVLAGGKNVAPEEVENALTASPFIEDAGVLERNGALCALVVPHIPALQAAGTARVDELMRIAVSEACVGLAPYQRITGFRIWRQPLPKTRLGKLQRFRLRALYEQADSADAAPAAAPSEDDLGLLEDPVAAQVWAALARRFPDRVLSFDTSPQLDLGIDSLGWIEIAHELETEAGIVLSEDMLAEVVTVRDLLRTAMESSAPVQQTRPVPSPRADPTEAMVVVGWLIYWMNRIMMRTAFRLRIQGTPPVEPNRVLVVSNHASDLDALFMAASFSWRFARHAWWGADVTRLYNTRLRRWFSRAAQIFPVDDRRPSMSLDQALALLARDESIVWFPESWRSPDGRLQNFSRGVGVLIQETRPTVVPAWIDGSFEALPRYRRWPRFVPVTVRFGDPVAAERLLPEHDNPGGVRAVSAAARALVASLEPAAEPPVRGATEENPVEEEARPCSR